MTRFLARLIYPKSLKGWLSLLAAVLCLLASLRIASMVYHVPVLGYANSYDMVRIQSCLHLWPDQEGVHWLKGSPWEPVRYYKVNTEDGKWCYYSTEIFFASVGTVIGLLLPGGSMSIQVFGFVHMMFMILAVSLMNLQLWKHRQVEAVLLNSILFLLLLSDPAITLYFNTIYAEFAAIISAYVALVMLFLILKGCGGNAVRWYWYIALFGLGFSKIQHCVLPLLLIAVVCWYQFRFSKIDRVLLEGSLKAAALPLIIVMILPANNMYLGIDQANSFNTYVATVLTHTDDREKFSEQFNINETCQQYQGTGLFWVDLPDIDLNEGGSHPCPEIADNSRLDLLLYTLANPQWLVEVSQQAFSELRPWIAVNFGHIQKQKYGRIWDVKYTLGQKMDMLPDWNFKGLVALFWFSGVLLFVGQCFMKPLVRPVVTFLYTLPLISVVIFFIAIFGDGLFDIWKHCNFLYPLMITFYVVLVGYIVQLLLEFFGIRLITHKEPGV